MKFFSPQFLWFLPAVALLGLALWWHCGRAYRRALELFVATRLRPARLADGTLTRRRRRLVLVVGALLALACALARPLAGLSNPGAQRQGVNVILAVDGSKSMLVEDVPPAHNRFDLAQAGINSLLQNFDGDQAGLIMFGGQATLISPITFDTVSLQVMARGLTPELVGRGGTSLETVIRRAAAAFHGKNYQSKVLVVFSDGEETEGDAVIAAQQAFQKEGIKIFTIGTGSRAGDVIPLFERNDEREWVRLGNVQDPSGQEIKSRMNPRLLARVAQMAGGTFVDLAAVKGDLREFYTRNLRPLAGPLEEADLSDLRDWFQVPLALALFLLVLEMLVPVGKVGPADPATPAAGRPGAAGISRVAPAVVALLLLGLFLAPVVSAQASVMEAQRLLGERKFAAAFEMLQQDLLAAPEDALAKYNYAVGAYASGNFTVAIPTFEKLLSSYEPGVANQSAFQLGNSYYRMGQVMRLADPEGTIAHWEKALTAYAKTPLPAAKENLSKARTDLRAHVRTVADARAAQGDEAARVTPDQGIPKWREALGYLDKALHLEPPADEGQAINTQKSTLGGKIYQAYYDTAEDQRRLANQQHDSALDQAIGLIKKAVGNYDSALELRPEDPTAKNGRTKSEAVLEPWLVELADREHAEGEKSKAISLEDAFSHWQKAAAGYTEVLQKSPANPAALAGQQANNHSMHGGYVEMGDRKQTEAEDPSLRPQDQDRLLQEAMNAYESALGLEPDNATTKGKFMAVGKKLTRVFLARGHEELNEAKRLEADEKAELAKRIAAAIPLAEHSVQSFTKALRFDPANADGTTGKKEAEEVLQRLRKLDDREQRKVLVKNKEMKNPEELKNQGKLALKLLEYDQNKLASKKQQNLSVPENKPLKDW
jgi:Ca-activated chloride channel family protein